mgnify:CR=1 FL=1
MEKGMDVALRLDSNKVQIKVTYCVILMKSLKPSEPQFPHLLNGTKIITNLIELL